MIMIRDSVRHGSPIFFLLQTKSKEKVTVTVTVDFGVANESVRVLSMSVCV
jgi:hypothetical protein